jgi:hypothetical protein
MPRNSPCSLKLQAQACRVVLSGNKGVLTEARKME